jgi:hypothetical protein
MLWKSSAKSSRDSPRKLLIWYDVARLSCRLSTIMLMLSSKEVQNVDRLIFVFESRQSRELLGSRVKLYEK